MKKRTFAVFILIFGFAGLGYLAWSKLNWGYSAPSLVRLSLENAFDSLDPAKAYSDDSLIVAAQVLEPLYQYHYLKSHH